MKETPRTDKQKPEKKPYRKPELIVFGTVAQLTRGGSKSIMSDHGMNSMWAS